MTTAPGLSCGSCGTELNEQAKFCSQCGAGVSARVKPAEYKQVTVLFADVVHSMGIAAAVGAERLREIMAELVDRCATVVRRYGGTVDKFTGDGIMAVFGAPAALEDHAVRACLAAIGVQNQATQIAVMVRERDGVDLRLRVGLNSGEVIAGEIGSRALGYTAVGEQVGMAQRMESAAPPGVVMLSASTARLVDGAAVLGEPQMVRIKGANEPVHAYRLLGIGEMRRGFEHPESNLVGRRREMSTVEGLLDQAADGHGAVAGVVGSPGIGKSRLVREIAAIASGRDMEVFTTFCESHATDIPFRVVARLLRTATGVEGLDAQAARAHVRARMRDAGPEDLALFYDLLGIADPEAKLPNIDPDARRRRLTALVNGATLARHTPAVYVIEDAHWIDEVSESMLAEFLTVIPQTPSLVLVTYRPEYRGALTRLADTHTVALVPLSDSETMALVAELLGGDPSVGELSQKIAETTAGNPFFAEEMVRDLAERGVLHGTAGSYATTADVAEVSMPATVQAAIAARIDRLTPAAKRTLSAAAVIGSRFDPGLLETLGIDPVLEGLVEGELINQITFTRRPEYVFHHPLVRAVAYASQLKSDRAALHRRVAAAIDAREPESADRNAALIAGHLEAADDLHAAYGWRMRASAWSAQRDIAAAWVSWQHARHIADALPDDDADRVAMRIAARTLLCVNAFRVQVDISGGLFEELRQLCGVAGDKRSLAIGMAGLVEAHMMHGRMGAASRVASDTMALIESIGDPTLTVRLSMFPIAPKLHTGQIAETLRWSQTVIDLSDDELANSANGNHTIDWPLTLAQAHALATRGIARCALGDRGWRTDLDQAVVQARSIGPLNYAMIVSLSYGLAISSGVLVADDAVLRDIEEALRIAERSSDDLALAFSRFTLGIALMHRNVPAERERAREILGPVRDMCLQGRFFAHLSPVIETWLARERARRGDRGGAIPLLREALDDLFYAQQLWSCIVTTAILVETLLDRGADGDTLEAEAAVERLATASAEQGLVIREIWLLRLRALLARARGDADVYHQLRDRYRAMANTLGFDGHIAWAAAMK
jgi:class 3 adenylate cyclase